MTSWGRTLAVGREAENVVAATIDCDGEDVGVRASACGGVGGC